MSKRRHGFPSETRVKRGTRVVHGDKVLEEKLGRDDLCPCGSGKRFKKCCFIVDDSLIVEEKIDGTNVGIHFSAHGNLVLQCRGHLIMEGMHPQYDLFANYNARTELVWIEPPFERLLRQNGNRKDAVPEQVVRKLAAKSEPPTCTEGHGLLMIDGVAQ
jgi:hypothetical protein